MRRFRATTSLFAAALISVTALVAGPAVSVRAASPEPIRYAYDQGGRLIGVGDPAGGTAKFTYDRVNDLTSISRGSATQLTVLGISPVNGPAGTQVTITGSGFDPTAANDTVKFNGTTAAIASASTGSLTVTVPSGASSGSVTVAVAGNSASSPDSFAVTSAPAAPAIKSFSPALGAAGTQVKLTGTGFDPTAANDIVTFNRTRARVTAASATSLTVTVPGAAGAGKVSVKTPNGLAVSSADFLIPPPYFATTSVESAARVVVDGTSRKLTVHTAGDIATVLFDGAPGEHLSVGVTGETFPGQYAIELYTPWWTLLGTKTFLTSDTGYTLYPLPTAGTYQLDIRPLTGTGSATVTLSEAAGAGTVSTTGGAVTVNLGKPVGQAGSVSFSGTIGQRLTLSVATTTAGLDPHLSVYQPAGSSLMFDQDLGLSASSPSDNFQLPPLPMSGTYTAVLDPNSTVSGSTSVQLLTTAAAAKHPPATGTSPAAKTGTPGIAAPAGVTAIAGRVLQLDGRPLTKVTLSIGSRSARSDAEGRFLLAGIPAGHQVMMIDGSTAGGYGVFEDGVGVTAGRTTTLGYPIWMTPLDTAHVVRFSSPTSKDIALTNPRLPGLEVRIPKGSTVHDRTGHVVRELGITPIPVSQPPFPLPAGVVTPSYFTVQPGSSYVLPQGAQVIYPNATHLPRGTRVDFWNYDPDAKGWYVYGRGTVTADGRQIVPDPDVKVWEFTGAMLNTSGLTAASTAPAAADTGTGAADGDPVDLGSGLLVNRHTDLSLPDTLPITLTRTWRQADSAVRPFGVGQNFTYGIFLQSANQYQEADLVLPDSSKIHYRRVSNGTSWTDAFFLADPTPTSFSQSSLAWNGTGWDLTLRDGTIYVFGENEPLQSIRDPHGNQIMLTHPVIQAGGITQITSPNGKWISLSYDNSGRVTQAADNGGRTVGYTYDSAGNLATVTDPAGGVTTDGYNSSNELTTIKDARGITYLTNTYDSAGRVSQQKMADGGVWKFAYTTDSSGLITATQVTDPNGNIRKVTLSAGYPVGDTSGLGTSTEQTTTFGRQQGSNWLTSTTDPLGRTTGFGLDSSGYATGVTWLAGTTGALTSTTTHDGPFNQVSAVTDPLGQTTTFSYDDAGNLATMTDPLGHVAHYAYNPDGQLASFTDPDGDKTTYSYQLGDLVSVTDPLGRTSRQVVDQLGRIIQSIDPIGNIITTSYDALDQPTAVTDPLGNSTQYTYDPNGNLLTVRDAKNHSTSYTYDSMDRLATVKDPLGNTASYTYDPAGNLSSSTSRRGNKTVFAYDSLNRLTKVSYGVTSSGSESSTSYGYDADNRLTTISDSAAGMITVTGDNLGQVTGVTTPQGSVGYTYDADGRRATMTVAGQPQVSYGYDAMGRLTSIAQGGATQVSIGYDAAGRRTSLTLPGGVSQAYVNDAAGQLTGITYSAGGTKLGDLSYAYDADGRQVAVGGSFARVTLPAATTFALYNANDQLPSLGTATFSYDADGNLTSDGTSTYTWNARDQLTGVSGGGQSASFAYNGLGQRISTTVNGTTTGYLYDGANIVQELSGSTPAANLLSGGIDEQFARTDGTGTASFLTDRLGSTTALADASGNIQTQYTYDPYGNATSSGAASSNPFQFTGRENDGTGLDYYRARYYSPALGRFLSEDPAGQNPAGKASGPNPYSYASDDPADVIDPSGQTPTLVDSGISPAGTDLGLGTAPLSGRKTGPGSVTATTAVTAPGGAGGIPPGGPIIGSLSGGCEGNPYSKGVKGNNSIVIGEAMDDRVIPAALSIGASYLNLTPMFDAKLPTAEKVRVDLNWLRDCMDEGYTIYDIGPAMNPGNAPDPNSPFYDDELALIRSRGYPVVQYHYPSFP